MADPETETLAPYLDTVAEGLMTVVAPVLEPGFSRTMTELAAVVAARVRADLTDPIDQGLEVQASETIRSAAADLGVGAPAFRETARAALERVRAREARFKPPVSGAGISQAASLEERLRAYLTARAAGSGQVVEKVSMAPGGRSKLTIFADLKDEAGARASLVLRLDVPEARLQTSVADEFPLLRHAFEQGCPVAEPLWIEMDPSIAGAPFMASVRMSGKMASHNLFDFTHVTPGLALSLAGVLARVHALNAAAIWPATAGQDARACTFAMIDDFEARFRQSSAVRPSPVLETAFALLRDGVARVEGPAAVVHADAGFHNVLIDERGEVQCLLDWEFSHAGSPEEDLTFAKWAVEQVMPWDDFLRAYLDAGGRRPDEKAMKVLPLWTDVRNLVFAANMTDAFLKGEIRSVQAAAVCLNTYGRLQNELAGKLLDFL